VRGELRNGNSQLRSTHDSRQFQMKVTEVMKRIFLTLVLAALFGRGALGSALPSFTNFGLITNAADAQVPATNYINDGVIDLTFQTLTSSTIQGINASVFTLSAPLFDFTDVQNYTNRGLMAIDTGFRFDTAPSGAPGDNFPRHMASSWYNANPGQVVVGSVTNGLSLNAFFFFFGLAAPQVIISASNVANSSLVDVGATGLISIQGNDVNLDRGALNVEGAITFNGLFFGITNFFVPLTFNIFPQYWGIGLETNQFSAANNFTLPNNVDSPIDPVVDQFGAGFFTQVIPTGVKASVLVGGDISNNLVQVVFVGNTNPAISTDVRWAAETINVDDLSVPIVQWFTVITNNPTLAPITNTLYLEDFFGSLTNFQLITNNFSLGGQPIESPFNYVFFNTFFGYSNLFESPVPYNPAFLPVDFNLTNTFTAYGVSLLPVTQIPDPSIPTSTITNLPGRVEIYANNKLDLTQARITGPNYLRLVATNHFVGSAGANIVFPNADITLATTNGSLSASNLVAPFVPEFDGNIFLWSARWTNIDATGVTNKFHVLMVDTRLDTTAPCQILNLSLTSTNKTAPNSPGALSINDIMNVSQSLLLDGSSLTIGTNSPGAPNSTGQLNLTSGNIIWSSSLPLLRSLTNSGQITTLNSTFFQVRQNPDIATPGDGPYDNFVNHGLISTAGNLIWANYVENTGSGQISTNGFLSNTNTALIVSANGPIQVQANTAVLSNSVFSAPGFGGDMSLMTDNLTMSNHIMVASGNLTVVVTNQLNFTANSSGRLWTNYWQSGDGLTVPFQPSTRGDLLGTAINTIAPAFQEVDIVWPGLDMGNSTIGFTNNLSVGHFTFDALNSQSALRITGTSGNNAIYIDLISLADAATNHANNNYPAFNFDPGMKIYFGGALIGNTDISEKLNGANGGAFQWVSNWNNGPFSSTNLLYPSGTNYSFNRALVVSCDIDSNGNGIPNCQDPTPIPTPDTIAVRVKLTNAPSLKALVSWDAPAFSTNYLYTRTNLMSTNWLLVTNFIQGPIMTPVTITNQARTTGGSLYRVGISFRQ
jgi:hypothetical protein